MKLNPYWFFRRVSSEYTEPDENTAFAFANKILELQNRIQKLEEENIEMTNALYELENRLESKIDKIHPVVYNLGGSTDV